MAIGKAQRFLDTLELRRGSVINADEVRALKQRWSPHGRHRETRYDEYEQFMRHGPYQVDAKATAAGLSWWTNMVFTPKGVLRNNQFSEDYFGAETTLPRILKAFSHFMLVDWNFETKSLPGMERMFPTYTMYGVDGDCLDFVARPWQSGGNYLW